MWRLDEHFVNQSLFVFRFFKRKAEEEEIKNKKKKTKKAQEIEDEEDENIGRFILFIYELFLFIYKLAFSIANFRKNGLELSFIS